MLLWGIQLSRDLSLTPSDPPSIGSLYYHKKGAQSANGGRKHCHFSNIRPQEGTDHNNLPQFVTRTAKARSPVCASRSLFLQGSSSCFLLLVYFTLTLQFCEQMLSCKDKSSTGPCFGHWKCWEASIAAADSVTGIESTSLWKSIVLPLIVCDGTCKCSQEFNLLKILYGGVFG